MNRIAERAGSLGLFVTANALADAKIDPDLAPRDARLTEPVAGDIKRIFGQMARRGSAPSLVAALWQKLEGRPLERALVAVDVLATTLLAPRDPLLAELREAASTLGAAHPPAGEVGIDLNAHPARILIERSRQSELEARSTLDLVAMAYELGLGVLDELLRRGDDLVARDGIKESVHAYARLASLARLPTLASVYFDWLLRGVDWRPAGLDLCETLFDAGVPQKIPGTAIQPGDVPEPDERDLAEYLTYRAHLAIGDTDHANAMLLQNLAQRPRWISRPSARIEVVRAHLGTLYGHGDVTIARVEAACAQDRLWRYAAKVRAVVAAKRAPSRALDLFHAYLTSFGNEFDGALAVISLVPEKVKRDVARILCREAFYLPHEPAPWKLLGLLGDAAEPIAAEIDGRLRAQSR